MTSTYTSNLGIEKPASGDQAGTWGTTTNTNFDIIDRGINGVGAISLSGTTHTLTTSDGSLSDGQYKVLVLGGSPSGTNTVTISPNDQDKLYFVYNDSGQDVIFTQGSGGNTTVENGATKIIYADGAGSGAQVSDFTAKVSIDATTLKIDGTEVTSTAAELNLLDGVTGGTVLNDKAVIYSGAGDVAATTLTLGGTAITATATELNYVDGVTSNIQTQLDTISGTTLPSGSLLPYAGSSAPSGFVLCYGQELNRTTYATLFGVIGTTYGTGDGSTTFNVPDLRGRAVAGQDDMGGSSANRLTGQSGGVDGDTLGGTGGEETQTLSTSQIPSHNHALRYGGAGSVNFSSADNFMQLTSGGDAYGGTAPNFIGTTSSLMSSTGGGGAHNNVQPTIILNYIMKT
jgi:microcystin-dependent protein